MDYHLDIKLVTSVSLCTCPYLACGISVYIFVRHKYCLLLLIYGYVNSIYDILSIHIIYIYTYIHMKCELLLFCMWYMLPIYAIILCYVKINILLFSMSWWKQIGCEITSQALLGVHILGCNITNKINYEKQLGVKRPLKPSWWKKNGCETTSQSFFEWT